MSTGARVLLTASEGTLDGLTAALEPLGVSIVRGPLISFV